MKTSPVLLTVLAACGAIAAAEEPVSYVNDFRLLDTEVAGHV